MAVQNIYYWAAKGERVKLGSALERAQEVSLWRENHFEEERAPKVEESPRGQWVRERPRGQRARERAPQVSR